MLAVAASVGAGSPVGRTIGGAAARPFSPPLFMVSFGGQDKPAGGQVVSPLDWGAILLGSPIFVTSLLFVLVLLLSALATPGDASATTTATIPATVATRRPLFIQSVCAQVLDIVIAASATDLFAMNRIEAGSQPVSDGRRRAQIERSVTR